LYDYTDIVNGVEVVGDTDVIDDIEGNSGIYAYVYILLMLMF
jgi:hypothetical protein